MNVARLQFGLADFVVSEDFKTILSDFNNGFDHHVMTFAGFDQYTSVGAAGKSTQGDIVDLFVRQKKINEFDSRVTTNSRRQDEKSHL